MKKALLMVAFFAFAFAVNAQNSQPAQAPAKKENAKAAAAPAKQEPAKAATAATPATPAKKVAALKEHTCSAECKDGKHAYAHGEKGHTCGDACKKMMHDKKKS